MTTPPWAQVSYTQAFLADAKESLLHRLRTLSTFVHNLGPHAEGLHVALTIARINLQNRHVHLWRFCDRPDAQVDGGIGSGHSNLALGAAGHARSGSSLPSGASLPTVEELPTREPGRGPGFRLSRQHECLALHWSIKRANRCATVDCTLSPPSHGPQAPQRVL